MREYLVDLIERMTISEDPCTSSDDSAAWHAHREAEALSDSSLVDELADFVAHEKMKERRSAAYFILGKLGRKVRDRDCASILLSRLGQEEDKYLLSNVLKALSGISKPRSLELGPVFRLLHDDRWLVRRAAIQALGRTDSPEAEDQLIEILNTTSDPYDVTCCQATLNKIGTAKAIPHLKRNLASRKRDVKSSAQSAIEAIESREKIHSPD